MERRKNGPEPMPVEPRTIDLATKLALEIRIQSRDLRGLATRLYKLTYNMDKEKVYQGPYPENPNKTPMEILIDILAEAHEILGTAYTQGMEGLNNLKEPETVNVAESRG